jgi:hypothetical protein
MSNTFQAKSPSGAADAHITNGTALLLDADLPESSMIAAPAPASGMVIASFMKGRRVAILAAASCFVDGTLWGSSGAARSASTPSTAPRATTTNSRAGCVDRGSADRRRRIHSNTKTATAYTPSSRTSPIAKSQ